ncbi:lactate utilization protein [Fodinisporobacter ferrooxydans]|uniref:Lactate utilization protein n=1 Tax=Fodinisporobacter ferrooxydans TaxID=2901836 RepID=A0ABY4CRY5_9BACL|nr:lactate utilization protein [Alicyclobacillaceae bacterium MYW30-H2]
MREEDFLKHLSNRLGRPAPLSIPPVRSVIGAPDFWKSYQLSHSEQLHKFKEELEKLGGVVEIFASLDALQSKLTSVLQELSPKSIGTWGSQTLAVFQLRDVLKSYPCQEWDVSETRESLISTFIRADVGITGVDYAIADTGSIVLMSSPEKGRSVSLLPSVHIALIRSRQMRTRMGEVLEEIQTMNSGPGAMPSSINVITGPSRSSDIENDLTIGVHGPVALFAFILDEGE